MRDVSRRELLATAGLIGGWLALRPDAALGQRQPVRGPAQPGALPGGAYALPPLGYDYADLEPHIDAQTMKLHHDVHHAGYVRNANAAVAELAEIRRSGGDAIRRVRAVTQRLAFNLSGHLLHSVFWAGMKRDGGGQPPADSRIGRLIRRDFGSFPAFAGQFQAAAQQVQGSGWGILAYEPVAQRLLVLQAHRHQNTGVWAAVPLLVVDVWEHAYYLRYQNRRSSYIRAFMNVIDWENVDARLGAAAGTA